MNEKVAAFIDLTAKLITLEAQDEGVSLEDVQGYMNLALKEEWDAAV